MPWGLNLKKNHSWNGKRMKSGLNGFSNCIALLSFQVLLLRYLSFVFAINPQVTDEEDEQVLMEKLKHLQKVLFEEHNFLQTRKIVLHR